MGIAYRIAIDIVAGLVVAFFVKSSLRNIQLAFATGLMSAMMAHIILFIEFEYRRMLREELQKISNRLKEMAEHAAFFTERNRVEDNIFNLLRRTRGRKIWIIAKFISRQLSNSFSTLRIDIEGDDYSRFSEKLYPECEHSIYLTCPFTPREWFEQLLSNEDVDKIERGEQLPEDKIPPHVRALISAPAPDKKRLVILGEDKWKELYDSRNINFLREFLRINRGIEIRFVKKEILSEKIRYDYDENEDIAIFDRELLLKWERPSSRDERTPLYLEESCDRNLLKIFEFERYASYYKTGKDLLTDVERARGNEEV